jgi:hypothetical protein
LAEYENALRRLPDDVKDKTVGKWKREIEQRMKDWGTDIFVETVKLWSAGRPMGVPNLAWQFFFSGEYVTYLDAARYAVWQKTPEGVEAARVAVEQEEARKAADRADTIEATKLDPIQSIIRKRKEEREREEPTPSGEDILKSMK